MSLYGRLADRNSLPFSVDDLLRGLGQLLGTLQMGNVAEWVGAIATVGALFWAFLVFKADRLRSKRAEADRFTSYIVSTTYMGDYSTAKYEFFNAGDTPVPLAYLVVRQTNGGDRIPLKFNGSYVLLPGAQMSFRLRLERHSSETYSYVYFRDSHNREWLRDITTGKYVSVGREMEGPWLRYRGGPRARWEQFLQNRHSPPPNFRQL